MSLPSCDRCPAPGVVIAPGADAERSETGILLRPAAPDRSWCLACAVRAGWPWLKSERPVTPATDHRQGDLLAGAP